MFVLVQYSLTLLRLLWLMWLWLWWLICTLLLTLALLLPRLPDYRVDLEQWLTGLVGQPVTLGEIVTYWEAWDPTLAVQNGRLLDRRSKSTAVEMIRLEVSLNLLASLQQQQLLTQRVELQLNELTLIQQADGSVSLAGLPTTTATDSNPVNILPWLLQQPKVTGKIAKLTWIIPKQPVLVFTQAQLTIQKQGEAHYVQGTLNLPQSPFHGLQAQQVTFTSVLQWDYARLTTVSGQFTLTQLQYTRSEGQLHLGQITGQFIGQSRLGKRWQVTVNPLQITPATGSNTPSSLPTTMAIEITPLTVDIIPTSTAKEIQVTGQIKQLPLTALSTYLTLTHPEWQSTLQTIQGRLENLEWRYRPTDWQLRLQLQGVIATAPQGDSFQWLKRFTLDNGQLQLQSQQGHLSVDQLAVTIQPEGDSPPISLPALKGTLHWQQIPKYWRLTTSGLQLTDKSMLVEVTGNLKIPQIDTLTFGTKENKLKWLAAITSHLKITANNLPMTLLQRYLPAKHWPTTITHLEGTLHHLQGSFHDQQHFEWQGEISQLGIQYSQPEQVTLEVKELTGSFKITPQQGSLKLQEAKVNLELPQAYSHPLSLTAVRGEVTWAQPNRQWQLTIPTLQALTIHQMPIKVVGGVTLPNPGGVPLLDLMVSLRQGQLENVAFYLPDRLWKKVLNWFHQAKLIGKITTAQAILKGPINALFDAKRGHFEFNSQVEQADIKYDPDWPPVTEAKIQVAIIGHRLAITAQQGKLLNNQIRHLVVSIDDLHVDQPVLEIVGKTHGPAADGLRFLDQSPLHKTVSVGEQVLGLEGPMELSLQLAIPLSSEAKTTVAGQIIFQRNTLHKKSLNLKITQLRGTLQFTQDSVSAKRLQGKLFGKPLTFSLLTRKDHQAKLTRLQFRGEANPEFLAQLSRLSPAIGPLPLSQYFSGNTAWQATLQFPNESQSQTSETQMVIETDLAGLGIELPAPLGKSPESTLPLLIEVNTKEANQQLVERTIRLRYGQIFNSLTKEDARGLHCGKLVWGTTPAAVTQCPQLSIEGTIPPLILTQWQTLYEQFQNVITEVNDISVSSEKLPLALETILIEVLFDQMTGYGQLIDHLAVQAKYANGQWQVALTNEGIEGQIHYRLDSSPATLELTFKKLTWLVERGERIVDRGERIVDSGQRIGGSGDRQGEVVTKMAEKNFDPRRLPLISFYCKTLKIEQAELGTVNLVTQLIPQGLEIALETQATHFKALAKAQWLSTIYPHQTVVQGSVTSADTGQMLRQLGIPKPPLHRGMSQVIANAQWRGAPYAFDLAHFSGRLSVLLIEGQLLPVEPGIGRLFGLFDIQALPKRLALDFNDVFAKGLNFNSIVGFWVIDNGIAHTDKLMLQGPIAQVEIQGNTHLINHTYDQKVTVIPHLSNALPLAGTLAGGPGVGAITLIMQQMLKAELEKPLNFHYRITGQWEAPKIEKVSEKP